MEQKQGMTSEHKMLSICTLIITIGAGIVLTNIAGCANEAEVGRRIRRETERLQAEQVLEVLKRVPKEGE